MDNRDDAGTLDRRVGGWTIQRMHDIDLAGAAQIDTCVLLTGRRDIVDRLAHEIHSRSPWRSGPFTVIDCDSAEAEVESMLFGNPSQRGAAGGTVLLREVGRLSPALQRSVAERFAELRGPEGHGRVRRRLMASTSEPLLPRVLDGTFDDRLFYRLNAIHVIPPAEPPPSGRPH